MRMLQRKELVTGRRYRAVVGKRGYFAEVEEDGFPIDPHYMVEGSIIVAESRRAGRSIEIPIQELGAVGLCESAQHGTVHNENMGILRKKDLITGHKYRALAGTYLYFVEVGADGFPLNPHYPVEGSIIIAESARHGEVEVDGIETVEGIREVDELISLTAERFRDEGMDESTALRAARLYHDPDCEHRAEVDAKRDMIREALEE